MNDILSAAKGEFQREPLSFRRAGKRHGEVPTSREMTGRDLRRDWWRCGRPICNTVVLLDTGMDWHNGYRSPAPADRGTVGGSEKAFKSCPA